MARGSIRRSESAVKQTFIQDIIIGGFLKKEREEVKQICDQITDPGDLTIIKLQELLRLVEKGLSQFLGSVNILGSLQSIYLPDIVLKKLNYKTDLSYNYYVDQNICNVMFKKIGLLNVIQQCNLDVWQSNYALLLWELEIRKTLKA